METNALSLIRRRGRMGLPLRMLLPSCPNNAERSNLEKIGYRCSMEVADSKPGMCGVDKTSRGEDNGSLQSLGGVANRLLWHASFHLMFSSSPFAPPMLIAGKGEAEGKMNGLFPRSVSIQCGKIQKLLEWFWQKELVRYIV